MGSPPTDLNALTGELTPPGIKAWAALKIAFDLLVFKAFVTGTYASGLVNTVGYLGLRKSVSSRLSSPFLYPH
tara:strand:- start:405 stop:623 length:219 start_codon:yes stop_codon:yes gene_type:complete